MELTATRSARFAAQFVDGLIALGTSVVLYQGLLLTRLPAWQAVYWWLFYILFCDALPNGQSWGKKVFKISVVSESTGAPCTWWQSLFRNLSMLLLGVIDTAFILGAKKRRLGDYIANTKVVDLSNHF